MLVVFCRVDVRKSEEISIKSGKERIIENVNILRNPKIFF